MKKITIFTVVLFISLYSCISSKMLRFEGRYQSEMLNEFGSPNRIISLHNGEIVSCYFYNDINPETNYKNVIGLFYIDSNKKIIKVEKVKTRLSLTQYLQTRELL